jgi:hypothetical protein
VSVLAVSTFAGGAVAQDAAPSIPTPSPRIQFETPDARRINFYVPVVTMEQIKAPGTFLQGYRIQIYANGTFVYQGISDVKTLGEVREHVPSEAVQALQNAFREYKFWQVPEYQFGSAGVYWWPMLVFTVREGIRSKTVYFAGQDHGLMLWKLVEDLVQSKRWRCPYLTPDNRELCESREAYAQDAVATFLKYEFPALQEMFK